MILCLKVSTKRSTDSDKSNNNGTGDVLNGLDNDHYWCVTIYWSYKCAIFGSNVAVVYNRRVTFLARILSRSIGLLRMAKIRWLLL